MDAGFPTWHPCAQTGVSSISPPDICWLPWGLGLPCGKGLGGVGDTGFIEVRLAGVGPGHWGSQYYTVAWQALAWESLWGSGDPPALPWGERCSQGTCTQKIQELQCVVK